MEGNIIMNISQTVDLLVLSLNKNNYKRVSIWALLALHPQNLPCKYHHPLKDTVWKSQFAQIRKIFIDQ